VAGVNIWHAQAKPYPSAVMQRHRNIGESEAKRRRNLYQKRRRGVSSSVKQINGAESGIIIGVSHRSNMA